MAKAEKLQAWLRFGRFTVTWECESRNYKMYEKCVCDCWNVKWVNRSNLLRWKTTSCWCFRKEKTIADNRSHGKAGTRIYKRFYDMKRRCECKNQTGYERYGGRWIKCEWNSFEDFYKDMWESYERHVKRYWERNTTIDRIDSNWNYCKENCRWATVKQQNNNRNSNKKVTYNWRTYPSIIMMCEKLWLNYKRVKRRLSRWWKVKDAVEILKNWAYKGRNDGLFTKQRRL